MNPTRPILTPLETVTTRALPQLDGSLQLRLGLSFLPLILALCVVGGGLLLGRKSVGKTKEFTPRISTWPFLTLLIGLLLSFVVVLEVPHRALPSTSSVELSPSQGITTRSFSLKARADIKANLDDDDTKTCTEVTKAVISRVTVLVTSTSLQSRTPVLTTTRAKECNITLTTSTSYAWYVHRTAFCDLYFCSLYLPFAFFPFFSFFSFFFFFFFFLYRLPWIGV